MLDSLSEKFEKIFKKLRGSGVLTEQNIAEALKEVRLALLEADVNFKIVKDFIERVRAKGRWAGSPPEFDPRASGRQGRVGRAAGDDGPRASRSGSGGESSDRRHDGGAPRCGKDDDLRQARAVLQGSRETGPPGCGRSSSSGSRRSVGESWAAILRSTCIESIRHRLSQADVVRICQAGVERGRDQGYDLVVLDTGGRLHIDDELMGELVAVRAAVQPHEILLVADAMTGQDAVTMASQFDQRIGLTGVILTKVEGDARGGAVLSIRAVTGKPIKFLGVGEKLDALELFHPDRMASRILGMGDVLSLIEKAQETFSRDQAEDAQKRLTSNTFTLEDFRAQLGQVNRLGSIGPNFRDVARRSEAQGGDGRADTGARDETSRWR